MTETVIVDLAIKPITLTLPSLLQCHVLLDIVVERSRQDAKWGTQREHPSSVKTLQASALDLLERMIAVSPGPADKRKRKAA